MSDQEPNLWPDQPRDERLDSLIRRALTTDVEPERRDRLERFWHSRMQRQTSRAGLRYVAALIAASLLFAVGLILSNGSDSVDRSVQTTEKAPPQRQAPNAAQEDASPPEQPASDLSAGREPTPYERLMFMAQTRTPMPSATKPTEESSATSLEPRSTNSPEELLAQAADRLMDNSQADARQVVDAMIAADSTRLSVEQWESRLLQALIDSAGDRQTALCRMLAVVGSDRSAAELLNLGRSETGGARTLEVFEAAVGVEFWADVAHRTPDRSIRIAAAGRLLSVQTQPALLAYLSLVADEGLRNDAIAAALEHPELPIDNMVDLLDHEEKSVRLAAAVALGSMNRCEMTAALIERVNTRPARSKEAWFALLACRCDAADEFLAHAAHNPRLLGQLNNARLRWAHEIGLPVTRSF